MTNQLPATEDALYSKLSGTSALTTLLGAGQKIFNSQADDGTAYPYVIFYLADGGMPNDNPSMRVDEIFRVEAVSDDGTEAKQVYDACFTALHLQELTITGWVNYYMACVGNQRLIETVSGQQIWRYIGDFNVRVGL